MNALLNALSFAKKATRRNRLSAIFRSELAQKRKHGSAGEFAFGELSE